MHTFAADFNKFKLELHWNKCSSCPKNYFQYIATPLNCKMSSPLVIPTNQFKVYGFWNTPYHKAYILIYLFTVGNFDSYFLFTCSWQKFSQYLHSLNNWVISILLFEFHTGVALRLHRNNYQSWLQKQSYREMHWQTSHSAHHALHTL